MAKLIYGLIGHPVGHSLSPAMHNAAFRALKIDAEYKLFDVPIADLEKFLSDIPKNGIAGANVTVPHKVMAWGFVQKNGYLDDAAIRLGAVNTLKVSGKRLEGFNTDGPGFYRSLVDDLKFDPEGKTIFVLGAGGAARAIVMYLGNRPKKIYVTDIDDYETEDLRGHFEKYYDWRKFEMMKIGDFHKDLENAELLIQATPIGMKDDDPSPIDTDYLHNGLKIYDLVYNRPATRLVEEAVKRGLCAVTGLGMLLYQGAIAFELWTGKKAPVEVMRKALKEALNGKA